MEKRQKNILSSLLTTSEIAFWLNMNIIKQEFSIFFTTEWRRWMIWAKNWLCTTRIVYIKTTIIECSFNYKQKKGEMIVGKWKIYQHEESSLFFTFIMENNNKKFKSVPLVDFPNSPWVCLQLKDKKFFIFLQFRIQMKFHHGKKGHFSWKLLKSMQNSSFRCPGNEIRN